MNKGLRIVLVITAILLSVAIFWSINKPYQFEKERDNRYVSVVSQLQDIGALQKEYHVQTGKYAGSIDTLIAFADTATIVIRERKDTVIYKRNAQGINMPQQVKLYKELGKVAVKDSIFKGRDYKNLKNMLVGKQSPYTMKVRIGDYNLNEDSTEILSIDYYFLAYGKKKDILDGLNKNSVNQEIEDGIEIQDSIVSVGNLFRPSTDGNWPSELGIRAMDLKREEEKKK